MTLLWLLKYGSRCLTNCCGSLGCVAYACGTISTYDSGCSVHLPDWSAEACLLLEVMLKYSPQQRSLSLEYQLSLRSTLLVPLLCIYLRHSTLLTPPWYWFARSHSLFFALSSYICWGWLGLLECRISASGLVEHEWLLEHVAQHEDLVTRLQIKPKWLLFALKPI